MANSYLNRTTGSPSNADKVTISVWVKRTKPGAEQTIIGEYGSSTNRGKLQFKSNDTLEYYQLDGGSETIAMRPSRLFRDPHAFYHIVIQYDSAQSTSSDRFKIYVNGTQETVFDYNTYPSQNLDFRLNKSGVNLHIGQDGNSGNYFEGYISHIALVDNAISAPTVFGETDSTSGIWKFKSPSGVTWGTNGFHLKMENSGAMGTDSSGNSNTFTVNGNLKQALDTPSNVHNTGNPLYVWNYNLTQSNANLSFAGSQNQWQGAATNLAISKGKWYYEAKFTSGTDIINWGVGFMGMEDYNLTNATRNFVGFYNYDGGEIWVADASNNTATTADYGTFSNGDIIGIALDYDNTYLSVYKNGSAIVTNFNYGGVGTSSTVKGGKFIAPVFFNYGSGTASANFGNGFFGTTAISSAGSNGNGSLFEYDVPSGFYALNTKNINTYG